MSGVGFPESSTHPLRHVAIIMDGNGRWAKAQGLSRLAGHRAGVERVRGFRSVPVGLSPPEHYP